MHRLAADRPRKELRLPPGQLDHHPLRRQTDTLTSSNMPRHAPRTASDLSTLPWSANAVVCWVLAADATAGRISPRRGRRSRPAPGVSMIAFGGSAGRSTERPSGGGGAPTRSAMRRRGIAIRIVARTEHRRTEFAFAMSRSPIPRLRAARSCNISISPFPPAPRSPSSDKTARARRRSRSSCAACTIRRRASSRSMASTFARSIWPRGARVSRPSSRTSSASSSRCGTTWPGGAPDEGVAALEAAERPVWYAGHGPARKQRWHDPSVPMAAHRAARRWQLSRSGPASCCLMSRPHSLDVRGEAEIFDRLLAAIRHCTTILISASFFNGSASGPHLRAREWPGHRARHARRAHGIERALSHDVRSAGATLHRRGGGGGPNV